MFEITVNPEDYFRNWSNFGDMDIIPIAPEDTTRIIVRPKRHIAAEKLTAIKFATGTNFEKVTGPFKISEPQILPDQTGWDFLVDTTNPDLSDVQYFDVFHPYTHSVAFWAGFRRMGKRATRNPELWQPNYDGSGSIGFYLITTDQYDFSESNVLRQVQA